MNPETRAPWFFERERYGGILCDLASHNIDSFLFLTGSTRADIVASQVGNVNHPQYPGLEDFGDVTLNGDGGGGYIRADWLSPAGLNTYGDGRLTILGTEGYIELRKTVDIAGRPGGNHLSRRSKARGMWTAASAAPLCSALVRHPQPHNKADLGAYFLVDGVALRAEPHTRPLPSRRAASDHACRRTAAIHPGAKVSKEFFEATSRRADAKCGALMLAWEDSAAGQMSEQ